MRHGWARPALGIVLAVSTLGCSSARYQTAQRADTERILGIAKLFEEQGQSRLAANMYAKVLTSQPDHGEAQQRLMALKEQMNGPNEPTPVMLASRPAPGSKQPWNAGDVASATSTESVAAADAAAPVQLTGTTEQTESGQAADQLPAIASADLKVTAQSDTATNSETPGPEDVSESEGINPFELEVADQDAPLPTAESSEFELPEIDPADDRFEQPTGAADPAVDRLITQLDSDDPGQRLIAAFDLGEMGGDAAPALPKLNQLLAGERDAMVRVLLAEAVAKINVGDTSALDVLRTSLDTSDERVQQLAVLAVSDVIENLSEHEADDSLKMFAPQVRPALQKALDHNETIVRSAARNGMGIIDQQ